MCGQIGKIAQRRLQWRNWLKTIWYTGWAKSIAKSANRPRSQTGASALPAPKGATRRLHFGSGSWRDFAAFWRGKFSIL